MASNILLIGMPGSGKSTVGVLLAKELAKGFLDTDLLIQQAEGCSLQEILDRQGYLALRRIEERVLLGLTCANHVIATGGSAAYSHTAMAHLKRSSTTVFLHATLETLRRRVHNFDTRGIARRPGQSFADLFAERYALYVRYADVIVDVNEGSAEDVVRKVTAALQASGPHTTSTATPTR